MTCDTRYEVVSKGKIISVLRGCKSCYFWAQEITSSADFWPRVFLNPEITMISGPIVDGFYYWRRRSLRKRQVIAQKPVIVDLRYIYQRQVTTAVRICESFTMRDTFPPPLFICLPSALLPTTPLVSPAFLYIYAFQDIRHPFYPVLLNPT